MLVAIGGDAIMVGNVLQNVVSIKIPHAGRDEFDFICLDIFVSKDPFAFLKSSCLDRTVFLKRQNAHAEKCGCTGMSTQRSGQALTSKQVAENLDPRDHWTALENPPEIDCTQE